MSDIVIVAIIAAGTVLLFEVFYFCGKILQAYQQKCCERKTLEIEFKNKLEWYKVQVDKLKETDDYKKWMQSYVDGRLSGLKPGLDMDRVALLYLVLTGADRKVSADNLQAEIDKVKNSFEFIKQYLK